MIVVVSLHSYRELPGAIRDYIESRHLRRGGGLKEDPRHLISCFSKEQR